MNKKLCLAVSLVTILSTTAVVIMTNKNHGEISGIATGSPVYEVTIDRLVQTELYEKGGYWNDSYAAASLSRPGTYCILINNFYSGGQFYNDGTKIFENTFLYEEGHSYANRFGFYVRSNSDFYFNPEDRAQDKPVYAPGFSDLQKIQLFMGEENELQYDLEKLGEDYRITSATYDEETNSYTIIGALTSAYYSFVPECYTGTPAENSGKKLVIKSIKLTYGCNG